MFLYFASLMTMFSSKSRSEKSGDGVGGGGSGISGMKWCRHLLINCCEHHAMACHSKNCTTVSYYSSYTFNNSDSLYPSTIPKKFLYIGLALPKFSGYFPTFIYTHTDKRVNQAEVISA